MTTITRAAVAEHSLAGELERVRVRLQAYLEPGEPAVPAAGGGAGVPAGAGRAAGAATVDELVTALGLSPFERDVLLLCAGVELDPRIRELCARAQNDPVRPHPSFALALAAFPDAHWSAVAPTAPLRRWKLLHVEPGGSTVGAPLRIDDRVLHYLLGVRHLDVRLLGLAVPVAPAGPLPTSQQRTADRLAALWEAAEPGHRPVLQLVGADAESRMEVARVAAARLGLALHRVRAAELPGDPAARYALARLLERESVLAGAAWLLDAGPETAAGAAALAAEIHGVVLVSSAVPLTAGHPTRRVEVPAPTLAERRTLWRSALAPRAPAFEGAVEAVVSQFTLGAPALREAAADALGRLADPHADGDPARVLWDACRESSRTAMDGLAHLVTPVAGWDDLVLPEPQRAMLRALAAQLRQRSRVHDAWGFEARMSRGLGVTAVFAGPSGTGKTMAAEVLARELRLDLYRIDLSRVVSKYIGETEKNLGRIFEAAETGGAILLFDEADALFGKRSEVRDSHDRYANIEVSYLLQRMEEYRGLAILTTNQRSALDSAFLRRVRFVVDFPFPDGAMRAEIWRRVFPPETPTEELDTGRLAQLTLAGGNIQNIALNGAFLAADEGGPVRMRHLLRAARAEYAKLERTLSGAETAGWA